MGVFESLSSERFPRSSHYHPEWVIASASSGASSLWLTEWLTEALDLRTGMRVLDLGCGRAATSIFLHREFGVQVWAADLWFSPSENAQRIRDAGVVDGVFPIRADARSLPFAAAFFDAVVSIDSYPYFGTDDLYFSSLARFVKPNGTVGIAGAGLVREIEGPIPAHLEEWWVRDYSCLHSAEWWRRHWDRSGLVDVEVADTLADGWQYWLAWQKALGEAPDLIEVASDHSAEIAAVAADQGRYLGYARVVGRRRDVKLEEPIVSIPTQYIKRPLLRSAQG
jgi:SAM-dependent methyltransferase